MDQSGAAPLAGRREWLGLAVLTLPAMLVMLDLNVLFPALPRITSALHASATQQLWITGIYGLLIAGFLVTRGRLGDRVERKRLLLVGIGAFGVLSPVAAYSISLQVHVGGFTLLIIGLCVPPFGDDLSPMGPAPQPREGGTMPASN